MQLTKHSLEIDHLVSGFWGRFAKSMVSVVHWGCGVQGCLGKRSHREELSFVKLKSDGFRHDAVVKSKDSTVRLSGVRSRPDFCLMMS